jgi:2-C-methyl-D-erythritol 4-phosphate cytidylyltransferase/2-C-methyl-D-erythritol 2,4-cyclodiphosphate synthase
LAALRGCPEISEIVLVVRAEDMESARLLLASSPGSQTETVVVGGADRQESVRRGLDEVSPAADLVLIHDGARPFVSADLLSRSIASARRHGAAVAAVPLSDTVKRAGPETTVVETLDRRHLWAVQTPQTFRRDLLVEAYAAAERDGFRATDDAALVEHLGAPVHLIEGSVDNFKITTPADLARAEERLRPAGIARTGFGYDVHRRAEGRRLVLGGVTFPGEPGLVGHSDADVLTHAVADAVLGAAALGDIGVHFPDTDPQYAGADSLHLLAAVTDLAGAAGYRVDNIDAVVVCEAPKVAPHVASMRAHLAAALRVTVEQVSVKGTTTEGMGFTGRGEAIAAYAVAVVSSATRGDGTA